MNNRNSSGGCLAVKLQQIQQCLMGICEMKEPKNSEEDMRSLSCTDDVTEELEEKGEEENCIMGYPSAV